MKRKLTLFLSAMMVTSSLPMTAYAANFKDIHDVPWSGASAIINSVADKGLLSGYTDNTFRARNNVTYCETMQMVYTTLTKSGAAAPMDAVTVYNYMQSLDSLKVPKWAQMAVAYGLSTGILDMQMVATNFAGGTKAATREDVAVIFGNAMGHVFGKEKDVSEAKEFADWWNIGASSMEQVSMLKRLGIIKGDDYNRFNPKNNINRAEMAVMLNNTFGVLTNGMNIKGEIVELDKNTGIDGTVYYYFAIETEAGYTEGFSVTDGEVPVYVGNTTETIGMSKLSKGDEVVFMASGDKLAGIRLMEGTTAQGKYDITGYVNSVKDGVLSLDNENTGETTKYKLNSGTVCYVEGEKVKRLDLENILKEHYKEYAYAGLITEVKREKVGNTYENVTYVKELHITFVTEYTEVGEVKTFAESFITLTLTGGNAQKTLFYAEDCQFIIADKVVSFKEAKALVDAGTTYAQVKANAADAAVSVTLAEDKFVDAEKEEAESKTYKLSSLSDRRMILLDGSEKITYTFGSENPLENMQFYTWNNEEEEWETESKVSGAEKYADDADSADKTVYVRVTFNSGDKLSEVYVSTNKSAWKKSEESQTDRKGTVASLTGDVLKFKTSSVEYKLLRTYKAGEMISGSSTMEDNKLSKNLLTKWANDSSVELYAEIKANADNEINKLEAWVKKAEGKLVDFDLDDEYIEIETKDGNVLKFATDSSPELTDEVENEFELKHLEGEHSKYAGETVTLKFGNDGQVEEITVGSGSKFGESQHRVKGVAVAADNGLKVAGDSTTYRWMAKATEIVVVNYSGNSQTLDTVKRLIEDPDVKVYVNAVLTESVMGDMVVESIAVYVQEAEGVLNKFGGTTVITTASGNRFSFDTVIELDTCDVNGYGQKDLEERGKGVGTNVVLTFNDKGDVCSIKSK